MKYFFYSIAISALFSCDSATSPYEKYIANLNNITKTSCASGCSYVFSATNGVLTVKYKTPNTDAAECSAKIDDLKTEWNTLEGDVEPGIDHNVMILCNSDDGKCFSGKVPTFGKIEIEIKGEANAEELMKNIDYLQQAGK